MAPAIVACSSKARPGADVPTWTGAVETVLARNCMACHHDGGIAPFSLATYREAKQHADAVLLALRSGRMPPWLPVKGYGEFAGIRHVAEADMRALERWVAAGMPRGIRDVTDSAVRHADWRGEWQLGAPDLVLELPKAFIQPQGSPDLFRNFVLPVPLTSPRFVRAVELSPGLGGAIHHAIIQQDPHRASRALAGRDGQPGFGGMDMGPSEMPDGHLLAWTPGKAPQVERDGYAWRLAPNSDLILQVHLPPAHAAHAIRPRIGLYFTDVPPRNPLAVVLLRSLAIDIAPGDSAYVVRDSLTLPVDVRALSVYPHAHFLARRMHVFARLPDGRTRWILRIDDWNFFWQDQYRFAEPMALPAGTRLVMEYTYDNSAANPRNPNRPPRRVRQGNSSTDEMATLSLQVELQPAARLQLDEAMALHALEQLPGDPEAIYSLANVRLRQDRLPEAIAQYRALLARAPGHVGALANLATGLAMTGRTGEAVQVLRELVTRVPESSHAWYNFGRALFEARAFGESAAALERSVLLDSTSTEARNVLAAAYASAGDIDRAVATFEAVLRRDPLDRYAAQNLNRLRAAMARSTPE